MNPAHSHGHERLLRQPRWIRIWVYVVVGAWAVSGSASERRFLALI